MNKYESLKNTLSYIALADLNEKDELIIYELVDKATPKLPIIPENPRHEDFRCSNCKGTFRLNGEILVLIYKYCPYCGQAINWGES